MSYRINVHEDLNGEIKRILSEQLDNITSKINDTETDFDEKVHAARKHLKKIRAVWRLVRDGIDKKKYRMENTFYRDTGRKLSDMRESRVYLNTMDSIISDEGNYKNSFSGIYGYLTESYEKQKMEFEEAHIFDQVTELVEEGKLRLNNFHLSKNKFAVYEKGIKRVYKRGTKALEKAKAEPTSENLHEWRKRVKYLWYHVRLLRNTWKPVLKGYEKSLDKLSDYLGDEHDLSDLKYLIHKDPMQKYPEEVKALNKILDKGKNILQKKAWPEGERIYAKPTETIIGELDMYLETHHA